jgi:hypothetical protein
MIMQCASEMSLKVLFFDAFSGRSPPSATQLLRPGVGHHEGGHLRELLAARTSADLTAHELRTVVEGNLWMLSPEAFRYFLPAFLHLALESYASVSVFASELIGALTEPSRTDVVEALDQLARSPSSPGLPVDMIELLRKQQLEWIDSGTPVAIFHERFDSLTHAEGAAVLAFLVAFQEARGADFPFHELENAMDRHWSRYRDALGL